MTTPDDAAPTEPAWPPHTGFLAIDVDAEPYGLPEQPADWWIGVLSTSDWWAIAQKVDGFDTWCLRLADVDDAFDLDDVHAITLALAEHVCALSWPAAVRLAASIRAQWLHFDPWVATECGGTDPLTMPVRRVLALMWHLLRATVEPDKDGKTEQGIARLESQVWAPSPCLTAQTYSMTCPSRTRPKRQLSAPR